MKLKYLIYTITLTGTHRLRRFLRAKVTEPIYT